MYNGPNERPRGRAENLEKYLGRPEGAGKGLCGSGSQTWAHLTLSAHKFVLQPLVSPQLGLQPTQVRGQLTGEACGFLLSRGDDQGDQEWRVECCTWGGSTSIKKPLPPLGSHLDLGEGFRQISVNSEGDRGISEQLASGLGQLTQLQPGGPVPGAQETSSKSALTQHRFLPRRLVWPALLLSGTGPKLPFSPPLLSLALLTNLPPWSPSLQLYYEFSRLHSRHLINFYALRYSFHLACSSLNINTQGQRMPLLSVLHLLYKLSLSS